MKEHKHKIPIYIVLALLIISGLFHLFRMMANMPMIVGHTHMPQWSGGISFVIAMLLAAWSFYALAQLEEKPPK